MSAQDRAHPNDFLYTHGLATPDESVGWIALTGGVSSEIWRVDLPGRSICIKRALQRLKVAGDWRAPTSRNTYEWKWLCFAAQHQPQAVPHPLAHDASNGLFAMSFLAPERFPVWKSQILKGNVVPSVASEVGGLVARLHAASAARVELAREFDSLENFRALRLEPYFMATAAQHPDLAGQLQALSDRTAGKALALVHGDVSPKNILIGPEGPVLLDAECAWYGDPAFDVAFCLNHLLLKAFIRPDCLDALSTSFVRFTETYFAEAEFESRESMEARVAGLLPALMLARIDGKSPVEYLIDKAPEQHALRRLARLLLKARVSRLTEVVDAWLLAISDLPTAK